MAEKSLTATAYDVIKKQILNCVILPGDRIDEQMICTTHEIGKTPFREAIIRLVAEQLVEVIPRKGMYASRLDAKEITEVFSFRKIFEPVTVSQNLHLVDLNALEDNIEQLGRLCRHIPQVDAETLCTCDFEFHHILVSSAHNTRLDRSFVPVFQDAYRISMLNGLRNEINKETWVETLEHHKLIYRAIMEENTDEIANAYNFHLNYYLSSALRTIRNLSTDT